MTPPDDSTPLGFLQETQLAEGQKDAAPRGSGAQLYKGRWHCYHVLVYIFALEKNPTFFGDG